MALFPLPARRRILHVIWDKTTLAGTAGVILYMKYRLRKERPFRDNEDS